MTVSMANTPSGATERDLRIAGAAHGRDVHDGPDARGANANVSRLASGGSERSILTFKTPEIKPAAPTNLKIQMLSQS